MSVKLETRYASEFIAQHEFDAIAPQVKAAHELLHSGTGLGNDFLGWVDLPTNYDKEEFARIKAAAARIQKDTDIFIVIGIGGSYLGARAAIEFLKSPLYNAKKRIPRTSILPATRSAVPLCRNCSPSVRAVGCR